MEAAREGSGLDAAHQAFERGDFAEAHKLALAMRAGSDEAARAAGESLLKKMSLDPLIVAITVACLIGFSLIALFAR